MHDAAAMRRRTSIDRGRSAVSREHHGSHRGRGTALHTVVCSAALAAAACAGDPPPPEVDGIPPGEVPERWQAGVGIDEDTSGDMRPEALDTIDDHESGRDSSPGGSGSGPSLDATTWVPPPTIRVWRRGLDHST